MRLLRKSGLICLRVCNYMKKKRVLFYSSVTDKKLFNIQQFYRIDIVLLEKMGYDVILSNSICDAWKFWKYDFVFAYFYRYSFFIALIAFLFSKPVYFTGGIDKLDSNWASTKEKRIQQLLFFLCYIISTRCIIVSQSDMANVRNIVIGHRKLRLSEHTIDVASYKSLINEKEELFVTILWQGAGNVYRKGVDLALKIYSRMIEDGFYQNSKFAIIGKKAEGTSILEELVANYGLKDRVYFTGAISETEKISYLEKSKYYFQLSVYEGFGLAPMEALYAHNIVIHSGRGGLSNPIYNYGILYERDDDFEKEYAKLIVSLKKFDISKLEEAHEIIKEKYCHERRLNDLKKIIKE